MIMVGTMKRATPACIHIDGAGRKPRKKTMTENNPQPPHQLNYLTPQQPTPPHEHSVPRFIAGAIVGSITSAVIWNRVFSSSSFPLAMYSVFGLIPVKLLVGMYFFGLRRWRSFGIGIWVSIPIGLLIFCGNCKK